MREPARGHIRGLAEKICSALQPSLRARFQRAGDVSGDRSVNADADAAVAPGRRGGRRRRFRAVFVLVVIRKCMSWLYVVHVCRERQVNDPF